MIKAIAVVNPLNDHHHELLTFILKHNMAFIQCAGPLWLCVLPPLTGIPHSIRENTSYPGMLLIQSAPSIMRFIVEQWTLM